MPTPNALPPEPVERFRADLSALSDATSGARRIGIAVSGGADSLALLLLAQAALPGDIIAATVDHGLRAEGAAEADMVAGTCAMLGVPHRVLRSGAAIGGPGNIQEKARILRYRLLADWAEAEHIDQIAVAHQMDDVAESFLMRASRGAGLRGLARMTAIGPLPYAARSDLRILRPLLDWRRSELATLVAHAGLNAVDDPSNRDDRYDRARMRKLLAAQPALSPEALARAATHLAEADAALDWIAAEAWASRVTKTSDGVIALDPHALPRDIQRRLALRAVKALNPVWEGDGIDQFVDRLARGEIATLAGIRCAGGKTWRFEIAPPHQSHR